MAVVDQYRASIRSAVRGILTGALDFDQAFESIMSSVRRFLTRAWHKGMKEGSNIQPSEMTPEERIEIQKIISEENNHITGLLEFAESLAAREAAGDIGRRAALNSAYARVDLWANRYPDVKTRALLMARGDPKLKWGINVVRQVVENCATCLKLNDKVKRKSFWVRVGVQPQNPPNAQLICGGWECGCALVVTDEPLSRGPLPRTP